VNTVVEIGNLLSQVDLYGVSSLQEDKIDALERYIQDCNEAMNGDGEPLVEDAIYDKLVQLLTKVRSDSPVLQELWSEDDEVVGSYNKLLEENPMVSILTVKSWSDDAIPQFIQRMPENANYLASYKINGHGIRVVYNDGVLVEATTRGRSTNGRDITEHVKVILGDYNEALSEYGLVEIRGELALKLSNLDKAREFTPGLKSAFSAVSSLIKPSATKEEVELLDFLTYGVYIDDYDFSSKEEVFSQLSEWGFETTEYISLEDISKDDLLDNMKEVVSALESNYEDFGYFCDGVVFEVSDGDVRSYLEGEGKYHDYNLALKVDSWSQDIYTGYIKEVTWKRGKFKLNPVAVVVEDLDSDEGVLTVQGNRVKNIPLYNPKNILILKAYLGSPLSFKYGGEAGVVPCFPDGKLLSEDYVVEELLGRS
jgi:DNA ligase (NAD+)